jgi:maltooligosyltrehalose trehalohydrolase
MSHDHGAELLAENQTRFSVWAPRPARLELELLDAGRRFPMERDARGFASLTLPVGAGARYRYWLDGDRARPDPASALQPETVHGPSAVVDLRYAWRADAFRPPPLREWVIYELHVGTFSARGDFAGVSERLGELKELGVTAVELMPVSPFPGARNWGYDGVGPYGVHAAYGGPLGLQRLVDAAHSAGLAVVLDVVYNHLGPEGNYLAEFAPYFTARHKSPWGDGIDYDGPHAPLVRRYFLDAALRWFERFHVDALRLDAIHSIVDASPLHVIAELQRETSALERRLGRTCHLIAESDLGESKVVRPVSEGGWGLAAQWSDDFHHAVHARLTGERQGYYLDFGSTAQVATALRRGYVYEGEASRFRGRPFGTSTGGIAGERFVVCSQNHDQVGNRALGERLTELVDRDRRHLAAALVLLAPRVPLLFMGEEYAEHAPFLYFTSHSDPGLAEAVSRGRRSEFPEIASFEAVPDPQAESTFAASRLDWRLREKPGHAPTLALYRALLALRRAHPSLGCAEAKVELFGELIRVERRVGTERSVVRYTFDSADPGPEPGLTLRLDTAWSRFGGPTLDGAVAAMPAFTAQVWLG